MANNVCGNCIHYGVCSLHEDDFISSAEKNGFCSKFSSSDDYVKVIKCTSCKHRISECEAEHGRTQHYCKKNKIFVTRDFFCSYGERR